MLDTVLNFLSNHWDAIAAFVAMALHQRKHAPKVESNAGKAFGAGGGQ